MAVNVRRVPVNTDQEQRVEQDYQKEADAILNWVREKVSEQVGD